MKISTKITPLHQLNSKNIYDKIPTLLLYGVEWKISSPKVGQCTPRLVQEEGRPRGSTSTLSHRPQKRRRRSPPPTDIDGPGVMAACHGRIGCWWLIFCRPFWSQSQFRVSTFFVPLKNKFSKNERIEFSMQLESQWKKIQYSVLLYVYITIWVWDCVWV